MKGDPRLVHKLDELLSDELTAIMQYTVHSEMCGYLRRCYAPMNTTTFYE
jgi:bacterioferritin (cytochrome b1)